ncbi:hypothetical protein OG562_29560 [Streptomyces sp. NBC_01275]|uniref:hypothetical protein n=1 Tax=Streptomyces sp. NBC_01275 TaxID=2903807 RepID=UPI002256E13F|nr:hypothetical protein [Streptomyces sp. NBC_01275]MCX4765047.1 hypothetical protein [Streptomyces sp. NBC_01275]
MPADEVTTGSGVDAARVRTGPRHAAPKKPLFTRFHMPAGKAIALAAMPTAVLMGMGFTPTLATAEDQPASKSLTIDEYKDCVAALDESDASASASPSPSASESTSDTKDDSTDGSTSTDDSEDASGGSGGSSSSDSGSDGTAEPSPSASSEAAADSSTTTSQSSSTSSDDTATPSPSASETSKNVLETIGDAITDLFDGSDSADTADDSGTSASPSPSASASASTGDDSSSSSGSSGGSDTSGSDEGTAKGTSDAVTDTVKDTAKEAADAADDATQDAEKAADEATASPSASESATSTDDCPVATLDESGIDNKVALANDPWYLNASSLLLKGADYQGVVEVKTADGTKKKVLKYVISDGTDIGDLHQTVIDKQAGKTYHVQAGSGTTSTIRNGQTIMYTESISGNLFGLIPVTFSPDSPPPLNIPLIYFTKVKVVQAGQFGGDLHIPGMHVYND